MNIDTFWQMIDETRVASNGDPERQCDLLVERLETMMLEEITEFNRIYATLKVRAYRADLWDAAYVIGCGCGNDGFMDFRAWLVQQGKSVYEAALKDPETLVDKVERGIETQTGGLWWVAFTAWENKTGQDMPRYPDDWPRDTELIGELLQTDEEHYARYPQLAAKFESQCNDWLEAL